MTLPEAIELMDYWQEWPPPHVSLARLAHAKKLFTPRRSSNSPSKAKDGPPDLTPEQLFAAFMNPQNEVPLNEFGEAK